MRVAIVGGGASGTLAAVGLLRHARQPAEVTLFEARGEPGPGVAYATTDPGHLLNVPAARMGALPGEPDHFLRWLAARGTPAQPGDYVPRRDYGAYLRDTLDRAAAGSPASLRTVCARVTDVRVRGAVADVIAEGRPPSRHDVVVLAVGPAAPAPPFPVAQGPRVHCDPWAPAALAALQAGEHAVVLGTGLTAVDVALSLTRLPGGGAVTAISRGGRLPHPHLPGLREPAPPAALPAGPASLDELEAFVAGHVARRRGEGWDWRDAFDGLRPHVAGLWGLLGPEDRRAFVEHRVRDWDVCRHRMAPAVAERVQRLRVGGRLRVAAGAVREVAADGDGVEVRLGGRGTRALRADRAVVCTGPGRDVRADPLLGRLVARGDAVPDDLGLGIRTTAQGLLVAADGTAGGVLATLGAPRRGELWETTAVPEIREQADALASAILGRAAGGGPAVRDAGGAVLPA